jgi:ribosome-associated protein
MRTQEGNRADALRRLQRLVDAAARPPRVRRPTKPTHASKLRRLQAKTQRGEIKSARAKVRE